MQPDDTLGAFALLDSLDEPGPALPIAPADARLLIQNAVTRAAQPMRPPRHLLRYAIAATLVAGTAAAAVWYTRSKPVQELPAPVAPTPPSIPAPPPPPEPSPAPEPAPSVVPPPAPRHPAGAQDLLRQANERRAQRRWRDAQALYRRVEREYPGSSPAYVAMLAEAALRLEHLHDAKGALALYRGALRGPSTLREEAAFGVIECYHAMGRSSDEKRALESFVAEHPDSPVAPRARERLQELAH